MWHPGKAAVYAGTLAVVAALGVTTPAVAGPAVVVGGPVPFAPGPGVGLEAWPAGAGGFGCHPGRPIYYYPTYAPAPPVLLYPTYGVAPPGHCYPVYGPAPPEGRVAPCHGGPPPVLGEPPLAAPLP